VSDKSWDADAELGSGRTLDLGDASLRVPETRPAEPEVPAVPAPPRRRRPSVPLGWIVTLVVLFALVGPLFGIVTAIITAFDDISESIESIESIESTDEISRDSENLAFLSTLDAAVSGTEEALPQCFFDEAASDLCSSTYTALADLLDATFATPDCSGYRDYWINSLRAAAGGDSTALQALYDNDDTAFPAGYAEARSRCVNGQ
jgi:hypothetical protein